MADFVLSCCSTVDLSENHLTDRGIAYMPFHYIINGTEYRDDLGRTMPLPQFYQAMVDGASPRTSQINTTEYEEYFEAFLEDGKDLLHVCLSSGLSGSYACAKAACKTLRKKYPLRSIYVIDSLAASSGSGLLVDKLADLRDSGMDIEAVALWANQHRLEMNHWVLSTDLEYFIRGGRVSKASGMFGKLLNICPMLTVDPAGHLNVYQKIRSKKMGFKALVGQMEAYAENGLLYADKCYISHSDCLEDAMIVAKMIEEKFPCLKGKVEINWIGTTIGSHTGPGTIALFFWGKAREETEK